MNWVEKIILIIVFIIIIVALVYILPSDTFIPLFDNVIRPIIFIMILYFGFKEGMKLRNKNKVTERE